MKFNPIAVVLLFVGLSGTAYAQPDFLGRENAITTTVPFLSISPDARSGSMGDVGVATTPDPNSGHWNCAKFAFIEKPGGVSLTYTPWLRQLVDGVSISYLSAYGRINKQSTIAGSLRFFSLGTIHYTDQDARSLGTFNPNEFAVDGFYSRQLGKHFSMGIGIRFIYSNLIGNLTNQSTKPGIAGAADLGMYYTNQARLENKKKLDYAIGLAITNIGNKITYTTEAQRDFIPINLRLGGSTGYQVDDFNYISFALDFNKLLVPTPPLYDLGADGKILKDPNGRAVVKYGQSSDVSVLEGMFQSFSDAPNGFKEEMQEVSISAGMEWWYQKQFAVRAGYFHEHRNKGNRKYLTFGIGIRYNVFGLDVSYLTGLTQTNPLQNTLRFSLLFDFNAFRAAQE